MIAEAPGKSYIAHREGVYEKYIKRVLDVICALAAMIVFCWLFAAVALLVRLKLGAPVIFAQERPGKIDPRTGRERIFRLYKFRTMTDERDENGELLPSEERLTKFGRALRSTSLDELPELWNIIRGDMSFVGPRPLLVKYLPLYNEEQRHRHDVRPGLTGNAQVNGRNALSWEEKFSLDTAYALHVTFGADVRILLATVRSVVRREGIEGNTGAIVEEFKGTPIRKD